MATSGGAMEGAPAGPAAHFSRNTVAPLILFLSVALFHACIGGGWLGLGRVDPLLAVPGLGYAAIFALWWHLARAKSPYLKPPQFKPLVLLLSLALAALVAAIGLAFAHHIAWGQLAALALLALLALILTAFLLRLISHWRLPWRLLVAVLAATLWQWASWPLIDMAYALPHRGARPHILLLSGLPLDGVGQDMSTTLRTGLSRAPMLDIMGNGAAVTRTEAVTAEQLAATDVLFLAHPRALPPEQLVLIDGWVRGGGAVLIAADGLWSSPSPYALGDPRNPPITSLLTPLLTHWGLRLDAPVGLVEQAVQTQLDGQRLTLFSPGTVVPITQPAACAFTGGRRVARCSVGVGRAIIVADADWLELSQWGPPHSAREPQAIASWRAGNMLWLMDRLDDLSARQGQPPAPRQRGLAAPLWVQ